VQQSHYWSQVSANGSAAGGSPSLRGRAADHHQGAVAGHRAGRAAGRR